MKILRQTIPYISNILFGPSARVHLENAKSFDEFSQVFNSKKRRDLKRILKKDFPHFTIVPGTFQIKYIQLLWKFLRTKYSGQWVKQVFFLAISLLLFSWNVLHFFEYYDTSSKRLCGWSSYFIIDDVYYDFISSANAVPISVIGMHSILFCLRPENHHIKMIDMGPTQLPLKIQKFGCVHYDILNNVYF